MEGYKHTEENINMYMMFSDLKLDLQQKAQKDKDKGAGKKKSSIKVTHRGKEAYKIYEDKVNMGDPDSDMIPYIRDYMAKENKDK